MAKVEFESQDVRDFTTNELFDKILSFMLLHDFPNDLYDCMEELHMRWRDNRIVDAQEHVEKVKAIEPMMCEKDETLELEKRAGMYKFLMGYANGMEHAGYALENMVSNLFADNT